MLKDIQDLRDQHAEKLEALNPGEVSPKWLVDLGQAAQDYAQEVARGVSRLRVNGGQQ